MNTRLLRLTVRFRDGEKRWIVPGYENAVRLTPPSGSGVMAWGWKLSWPGRDAKGPYVRTVDLDRHRRLAMREIRALLETVTEDACV